MLAALDRGEPVALSPRMYRYLCESRPPVGATRAGLVISFDGRLVQVTGERGQAPAQAVGVSLILAAGHVHRLDCAILSDGWELVYCRSCGEE